MSPAGVPPPPHFLSTDAAALGRTPAPNKAPQNPSMYPPPLKPTCVIKALAFLIENSINRPMLSGRYTQPAMKEALPASSSTTISTKSTQGPCSHRQGIAGKASDCIAAGTLRSNIAGCRLQ